jgi:hypothetical protein
VTGPREAWQAPPTEPPTRAERSGIEAAVRDYYEGWFDADASRMARAVHPALAKRAVDQDPTRSGGLDETSAQEMIEATARGMGRSRAGTRRVDVTIDHAGAGLASVTVHTDHYVEYLHLVRTPDGWRIINALWRWADGHGPRA